MKFKIVSISAFVLIAVLAAFGYTKTTSLAIINSLIDSTPIGNTTPAAGHFTTLNATGNISTIANISAPNGNVSGFNGLFGTVAATSNGAWAPLSGVTQATNLGFNQSGSLGESDLINQRGGLAGGFAFYSTNGSTVGTQLALLNGAGLFSTLGGFSGPLIGNVTGNGAGTWTGPVVGNSATATALAAAPSGCGTGYQNVFQIAANGNASCSTPVYGVTTSVTSTAAAGGSSASTTVPLFWKFGGTQGSVAMPDTNYAVSCSMINATGFPFIYSYSKTTTNVTVTYSNGFSFQAVASGASEIDCTVTGS
jgi:hypothetical protein